LNFDIIKHDFQNEQIDSVSARDLHQKLQVKSRFNDLNSYYFIPKEFGKFLNKSAVEVNKILEKKGFQIKVGGVWELTKQGEKYAIQLDNSYKTIKWKLESLI